MMEEWFKEIERVSKNYNYEFMLPIHPNPHVSRHQSILKNVKVVGPMAHPELLQYLADCTFVITDSGGIQEEASFLKKPCVVCRKKTERVEGLNNFSLLCESPSLLSEKIEQALVLKMEGPCPYGDGNSSEKIVQVVKEFFQIRRSG